MSARDAALKDYFSRSEVVLSCEHCLTSHRMSPPDETKPDMVVECRTCARPLGTKGELRDLAFAKVETKFAKRERVQDTRHWLHKN